MNLADALQHADTIQAAAAAIGCTGGGVCLYRAAKWWRSRAPIRAARRARRAARRAARRG